MNRIKVFISYSSKQKIIGGRFKYYLNNYCGYETFIAHDDIPPSSIFEEEILKAIESTDLFIPLLSDKFKTSDFTDQETGVAVGMKKKIFPIKLQDLNPYGFINKYHALQYKEYPSNYFPKDNSKELVLAIAQVCLKNEVYRSKAIDSLLYAFCRSTSFEITNTIIELLSRHDQMTSEQLDKITTAIKTNVQISGAWGLEEFKKFLHTKYNWSID
ncbi:MAG: toll/interleukin-1 receptor domain-containing protein [Patescibacteria group bacterium]